jgi:DNA-directed RNA polymerase subunit H (RpoH/RPB5)
MNNLNQRLFAIYENIQAFYEYRKLTPKDPPLTQDQFSSTIQKNKYMLLEASAETGGRAHVILLIYPGTECETKRVNMMKLIQHIAHAEVDVLVITQTKVSAGVLKGLQMSSSSRRTFRTFTYALFGSVLPKHELVPRYEIMSAQQIEKLGTRMIDPDLLPRIFDCDPQMVWLGAQVGDVVRFVYPSEVTIEAIGYCRVVASA